MTPSPEERDKVRAWLQRSKGTDWYDEKTLAILAERDRFEAALKEIESGKGAGYIEDCACDDIARKALAYEEAKDAE